MVFSTFILWYVESKFTILTYLMENNTVITVISYRTKGTEQQQNKTKACPYPFQGWYAREVEKKINAGRNTSDIAIEMGIPVMRELTSRWLIDFYQYVKKNPAIIDNGWKKCGITDALANGVPSDDPFAPIWWTELLFTWHFLFFIHCFVCPTDYRIMFKSNL